MISVFRYPGTDCITPEIIRREIEGITQDKEIIFVVPEFAKAQVEREIVSRLAEGCSARGAKTESEGREIPVLSSFTGGDVVSFITLSTRILDCMGREASGAGSDIMMRCAIYSILANYSGDFKTFGKLTNRFEYINMLINLLGDFSRYGIQKEELDEAISASAPFSAEYRNKLEDLRLVMDAVGKMNDQFGLSLLKDRISEAVQEVTALPDREFKSRRMAGLRKLLSSRFVFVGFGAGRNLTLQERALVKLISAKGGDICFYTLSASDEAEAALPIYKVGNEFASSLISAGAKAEDLDYRYEGEMNNYFMPFVRGEDYDGPATDKIRLAAISGTDNQIGYVFSEVIRLTREEGYRYRDIRVVCCDDEMSSRLRSNAELYGLDIFIDRKIDLWSTVIPVFAETVLELPVHNYRISDVLRAMRCGVIKLPPYIVDSFENYCRKMNITDGRRLFRESIYLRDEEEGRKRPVLYLSSPYDGLHEGSRVDAGEFFWEKIVRAKIIPIKDIAEKINSEKNLSGKAGLLRDLIGRHREDVEALSCEQLETGDSSSASALVRGYDEMMQLLTFFTHEMNDVPISQRAFISLIRTDMKNRVEGTIPLKVDSIEITTPDRAFVAPCKVMFLLGATRDNFPHRKSAEGLLSSGELRNLADSVKDCELPDKDEVRSREETVTCCLMLGTVTDRLYMVHNADKNFTSSLFDYLLGCVEEGSVVTEFSNPAEGVFHKRNHDFKTAKIDQEVMERLLVTEDKTRGFKGSVSSFEEYNTCSFKYMLNHVLKIRERDDNTEIDTRGFGTLIHSMYEIGLKNISQEDFTDNVQRVLSDEASFEEAVDATYLSAVKEAKIPGSLEDDGETVSKDFDMSTGMKLKRMYRLTFRGILEELQAADLIPKGFEVPIGEDKDVSIDTSGIEADTGLHLAFNGFVDRFDADEENKMIRIIDYKSGNKSISPKQLFYGVQIQLPVYTKALADRYEVSPDNCDYGYFNVGLGVTKDKKTPEFKPKLSKYSADEREASLKYASMVLSKTTESIKSGKADALVCPAHNYCSFCTYGGACGNVPSHPVKAEEKLEPGSSKADILTAICDAANGNGGEDHE
ncbi:MAG: PD-(D/E)XK nuclease family protein [Saccharofermentans sp.]|nr:PD-(D/E)XK nuclease family protein [Saccharofermentans sp.]